MKYIYIITGGEGFIGYNFIKSLLKKNIYIISIDNNYTGNSKRIKSSKIRYIRDETKNIEKVLKNIDKSRIKFLFHFGEFSRIVVSFEYLNDCFNSNIIGTLSVVKFCSKHNIKIIYSASSSKFGNNGKDEHLSPYSWSKSKNIEIIKNFSKWYKLKYQILYFFNVYGENHHRYGKMASVIAIFERQYLENQFLTVVKPGNQKRDFTHISDLIKAVNLVYKKSKVDEMLIASGKQYTIIEVAKMFNYKWKYIKIRNGERFSSKKVDLKKTYGETKFKPKIDLKDYIHKFINDNPKT